MLIEWKLKLHVRSFTLYVQRAHCRRGTRRYSHMGMTHSHICEPFVCISIDFDLHKPEELIFFCSWFCSTFFRSLVLQFWLYLPESNALSARIYGTWHNTRDANCRCLHARLYEIDCALIRRLKINYTQISIKIHVPIPQTQHTHTLLFELCRSFSPPVLLVWSFIFIAEHSATSR